MCRNLHLYLERENHKSMVPRIGVRLLLHGNYNTKTSFHSQGGQMVPLGGEEDILEIKVIHQREVLERNMLLASFSQVI